MSKFLSAAAICNLPLPPSQARIKPQLTPRQRSKSCGVPQGILALGIAGLAWLTGAVPQLSARSLNWDMTALAQVPATGSATTSFSTQELRNFARAALKIENERSDLAATLGAERLRDVTCSDVAQMNLPAVEDYCQRFQQIVDDNELKVARFNLIWRQQRSDASLRQDIITQMRTVCSENSSLAPGYCAQLLR
ncbi:MAG: DUF4168 domain-containing protein [Cyanobacteria bacterium P01_H01_bin.121]